MQVSLTRADGLYLNARASLRQLAADEAAAKFAAGLLPTAVAACGAVDQTLAAALVQADFRFYPLLAALLALDAEVSAVIEDEQRIFPLPGFLTYRAALPLAQFPPNTLRLPPLNPDGHYLFFAAGDGWLVVRADVHPTLRVAGHVRVVVSGQAQPPQRLHNLEHRLERAVLNESLLNAALTETVDPALPAVLQLNLAEALRQLLK